MNPSRVCSIVALLSLTLAARPQKPRLDLAPKTPPSSCGIKLITTAMVIGSPAYVRLRFQLDALASAQDGVTTMTTAQEDFKKETTPSIAMSSLFIGMDKAHDTLLCAASIIDRYKPTDKDDETAKALLIVAYNQEANAIGDLQAHIKEQMARTASDTTATQLKDAERITAMNALQQEAVDTLLQVAVMSLMETVDLRNPEAKNTAQTLLSCEEFEDLHKRSTEIVQSTKSAYTDTTSLFVSFFDGHKCKA